MQYIPHVLSRRRTIQLVLFFSREIALRRLWKCFKLLIFSLSLKCHLKCLFQINKVIPVIQVVFMCFVNGN